MKQKYKRRDGKRRPAPFRPTLAFCCSVGVNVTLEEIEIARNFVSVHEFMYKFTTACLSENLLQSLQFVGDALCSNYDLFTLTALFPKSVEILGQHLNMCGL